MDTSNFNLCRTVP